MVTYEDAPYQHPDDMIQDQEGRVIPRGGRISVHYEHGDDVRDVIDIALDAHTRAGFPGVFTVLKVAGDLHIVPRGFRNSEGWIEKRIALFDTMVSLPEKKRNGLQLVEDIVLVLGKERGEPISIGMLPTNALVLHVCKVKPLKGSGRNLLVNVFRDLEMSLSWQLFNDPGKPKFFLNIHHFPGYRDIAGN
jgi:hypothetical protein